MISEMTTPGRAPLPDGSSDTACAPTTPHRSSERTCVMTMMGIRMIGAILQNRKSTGLAAHPGR